jgi:hypothetical protein
VNRDLKVKLSLWATSPNVQKIPQPDQINYLIVSYSKFSDALHMSSPAFMEAFESH